MRKSDEERSSPRLKKKSKSTKNEKTEIELTQQNHIRLKNILTLPKIPDIRSGKHDALFGLRPSTLPRFELLSESNRWGEAKWNRPILGRERAIIDAHNDLLLPREGFDGDWRRAFGDALPQSNVGLVDLLEIVQKH